MSYKSMTDTMDLLKELMKKRHPNKEWYFDNTIWKDDDFLVKIVYSDGKEFPLTKHEYSKHSNEKNIKYCKRILTNKNWFPESGRIVENIEIFPPFL